MQSSIRFILFELGIIMLKIILFVLPIVACPYAHSTPDLGINLKSKTLDMLILDVDPGIDDIEAITLLLSQHKLRKLNVLAIFVSEGNTHQKYGIENTYRLLQKANMLNIPVYAGSNKPILPHHTLNPENYFGKDGFADLEWDGPKPPTWLLTNTIAPVALYQYVRMFPKQITYFTLGPMTNLAMAVRMYDGLSENLKEIYAMGGMHRDVETVPEFNIEFDPESVEIVVDQVRCPMTFLTWQACLHKTPERCWFDSFIISNPVFEMVHRAETALAYMHPDDLTWVSCDPMTAIIYMDKSVILESYESPVQVQLDGGVGCGVISNFSNEANPDFQRYPVRVVTKIDMDKMQQVFIQGFRDIGIE